MLLNSIKFTESLSDTFVALKEELFLAFADFDVELDTRGLFCPEPVMLLHNHINNVTPGRVLKVIATDPSTTRDIPRFCQFLGHELVDKSEQEGEFIFLIRRAEADS
jgi:tRNA 2-thiouridine synthesizing protein A